MDHDPFHLDHVGQFGESYSPEHCGECGEPWTHCERLRTGDSKGLGGWEDWLFCQSCKNEMFYPVVRGGGTPGS